MDLEMDEAMPAAEETGEMVFDAGLDDDELLTDEDAVEIGADDGAARPLQTPPNPKRGSSKRPRRWWSLPRSK